MVPRVAALVAMALVLVGCSGDASPERPGPASQSPPRSVRVALVLDRDAEGGHRAAAAFQGASLAFSNATNVGDLPVIPELVMVDAGAEASAIAEAAATIVGDPTIVAAIAAPGIEHQAELGDALDEVGVPWISLSGLGEALATRGWTGWRRMVADQATQGGALGRLAAAQPGAAAGVCLAGDGTPPSRSLLHVVHETLGPGVALRAVIADGQEAVTEAAARIGDAGCGIVVWGGEGSVGAALRRQLVEIGAGRAVVVGGDRMRDREYLDAAGADGEGSLATCPCVDLSTSTELAAQRFIQDYQSEFGLPPGPYAVEAWDAARLLLPAFRDGASTREDVMSVVAAMQVYEGLAGTYRFEPSGELVADASSVRASRVEGGRWLELPSAP